MKRLNREIRRRTDVAPTPQRPVTVRLLGAVLMEQTNEWVEGWRYRRPRDPRRRVRDPD